MAKMVKALFVVVMEVLAAAGVTVSEETAKAIRSLCGITQKTGTDTEKFKVFMEMIPAKKQSLEKDGIHVDSSWVASNIVKAVKQNEAEDKFGGISVLLRGYISADTMAFLKGEISDSAFTMEPRQVVIDNINSQIHKGQLTVNGEALRSRLVKLFNLGANQIIMHVSKEGMAESFRLVSTSEQDIDESIPEMSDAEYNASDIECNVTDASQVTVTQVPENKKGGVNPNLVSTLEGITGNKIERVQNKKEEKKEVKTIDDIKINGMDLLAVVSKNKQIRIQAGEKRPIIPISTEEAMKLLKDPAPQNDVYRQYVLAFHKNEKPKTVVDNDIPKGAKCYTSNCYASQRKEKKYAAHEITVLIPKRDKETGKAVINEDGKPEMEKIPMDLLLEIGTPTPQGFVCFKGKNEDPIFKFAWGLDPRYGNVYYKTPYVQHRPPVRDNNGHAVFSNGKALRQKWQKINEKDDSINIIQLIQNKLVELGFGTQKGGIPGTEITLWG